jgi:hypothetical protein
MHWNMEQVLWALVLAAHLLLLIVLMGRDRIRSFPWFTAVIVLSTVRLLADHLLAGKLTTIAFYWQSYSATALDVVLSIAVLLELSRRVFSSGKAGLLLKPRGYIGWSFITVAIAAASVWGWTVWTNWQMPKADHSQIPLLAVYLIATKGQLFLAVLTIEVALLLRFFGGRFGFGWKSHVQQIALGLSTNCIASLAVQGITESIIRTLRHGSPANIDRERITHLFSNLDNARFAIWFLVLLWWTIWLGRDESDGTAASMTPVLVYDSPEPLLGMEAAEPDPAS